MIKFRQATHADRDIVVRLLLEVSFCTQFLYGSTYDQRDVAEQLGHAFLDEANKSSYNNIIVVETLVHNIPTVIGLVNYYDYFLHKIDSSMIAQFNRAALEVLAPIYDSITPYSYYISALIVDKHFRNLNIGLQLIDQIINKTINKPYSSLCLHVWADNVQGIRFYQRHHFELAEPIILNSNSPLLPPSKKIHLATLSTKNH